MVEPTKSLSITIEFAGGAELLFDKIKKREVHLPPLSQLNPEFGDTWMLRHLLVWMKNNLLKERPELFLQQGSIRPGILVLVNDEDWELIGELDYQIKPKDCVLFISTLHGG